MRALFLIPALLVAGCAAAPVDVATVQARAAAAPDFALCRSIILGHDIWAQVAAQEIAKRHVDCAPYAAAIVQQDAANRAAQAAAFDQAARMFQPAPMAPLAPMPINCRTVQQGIFLSTTCN